MSDILVNNQTFYSIDIIKAKDADNPGSYKKFYEVGALDRLWSSYQLPEITPEIIGNMTKIPQGWFASQNNAKYVEIPDTVVEIEYQGFSGINPNTLILSNGLTTIENQAFYGLGNNVKDLRIPDNVQYIGNSAFRHSNGLQRVIFGENFKGFKDWGSFDSVYTMRVYDFTKVKQVPVLGQYPAYVFQYIDSNCKIITPDDLYEEWISTPDWETWLPYIISFSSSNYNPEIWTPDPTIGGNYG